MNSPKGTKNQLLLKIQKPSQELGYTILYIMIIAIGFIQGLTSISDLPVSYLFKDDYNFSPSLSQSMQSLTNVPWIIKPAFGFISDSFPILGYRRKSYLIICNLINLLCWLHLSLSGIYNSYVGVATLVIISSCECMSNVIGEALLVELSQSKGRNKSEKEKQQIASNNVTLFFIVQSSGVLITANLSGYLLQFISKSQIFLLTAILPVVLLAIALVLPENIVRKASMNISNNHANINLNSNHRRSIINEQEQNNSQYETNQSLTQTQSIIFQEQQYNQSQYEPNNQQLLANPNSEQYQLQQQQQQQQQYDVEQQVEQEQEQQESTTVLSQLKKLANHIKRKEIFVPLLFILIFLSAPSPTSAIFYFYTNHLHFPTSFMGTIQSIMTVAEICGMLAYNRFFTQTKFKKIFIFSTIFYMLAGCAMIVLVTGFNDMLGINPKVFCLFDNMMITTLANLNMTPILVLACRICPKNIEGAMYAIMMSIINLGGILSDQSGSLFIAWLGITSTQFNNLWVLIIISNISMMIVLPAILCIDFEDVAKKEQQQQEEQEDAIQSQQEISEISSDLQQIQQIELNSQIQNYITEREASVCTISSVDRAKRFL